MKKPNAPDNKKSNGSQSQSETTSRAPSRPKHSKTTKEPVTIDLPAEDVKKKEPRSAVPAARRSASDVKGEASAQPKVDGSTKRADAPKTEAAKPAQNKTEPPKKRDPVAKANTAKEPAGPEKAEPRPGNAKTTAKPATSAEPKTDSKTTPPPKPNTTANAPAKAANANENRSGGGKLVAGIVGGVIALGGAGAAQYLGLLGTPGATQVETVAAVSPGQLDEARNSLQERIAALEAQLAQQAAAQSEQTTAAPTVDMNALNTRIDTRVDEQVRAAIAALPTPSAPSETNNKALAELQQANAQTSETLAKLQSQLATTEETVSNLQGAINGGEAGETAALSAMDSQLKQTGEAVAALSTRLETLATRLETLEQGSSDAAANDEVTASITALGEQVSAVQATVDAAQANLANLQQQEIAPLKQNLEQTTSALSEQVSTVAGRVDGMQEETQKISALSVRLNELSSQISGVTDTVTAQSETLAALQEATTTQRRADQQAAQAIAAAALKGDVDQGRPFEETLATLRQVSGDETLLADLDAYAAKGVPTSAQLIDRFSPVRDAMEKAITPESDGSLTSRLLSGAQSLVKVKPLEPLEGETPAALLSQLDAVVQKGELAQASALWQAMPEEAKAVSTPWHDDLKARLAADGMVDTAVQSFLMTNATQ
ncbi:MAG: hypothetical protein AAF903_06620 [Pseudomonadota bacterium]